MVFCEVAFGKKQLYSNKKSKGPEQVIDLSLYNRTETMPLQALKSIAHIRFV